MLLTLTTTRPPATDLGYLLAKHPDRFQSFDLSFGQAHVFFPEAAPDRCTAALLLEVDPVGKGREQSFLLDRYVNDRPFVASSFLSVALAQVLRSAMAGRCKEKPVLAETPLPLTARLEVLPARGGERILHRVFEPLGYAVGATRHVLDAHFPEWGDSPYYSVTLTATKTVAELLTHLYVLAPVFDDDKHYYVGDDELEKLLEKGAGWLATHPEKEWITRRYLRHQRSLYREALARLVDDTPEAVVEEVSQPGNRQEETLERPLSLNDQRHGAVLAVLRASGAASVLDLGCGEGKLLRALVKERQFRRLVGLDVAHRAWRSPGCDCTWTTRTSAWPSESSSCTAH